MASAAQGISIGDAVLTCLADFSQLKAQVATLNSEVPQLLRPVADATAKLGSNFDQVTDSVTDAGKSAQTFGTTAQTAGRQANQATSGTKDSVSALSREMGNLSAAIQALTGKFESFGKAGREASRGVASEAKEARGALELIGDQVGITLPRELRSFITELPGFASAISLAFAPAAILTFIGILSEIPEKVNIAIDYLNGFGAAQKAAFTGQLGDFNSQMGVALGLLRQQTIQQQESTKSGVDGTKAQVQALGDFQQQLAKIGNLYKAAQQAAEAYGKTATDTQEIVSQVGSGPEGAVPINIAVDPQQIEKQKEKAQEEFLEAYKALQEYTTQLGQQQKVYLPTPTFNFKASDSAIRDQLDQFHKTITDQITSISNEEQQIEVAKNQSVNSIQKDGLDQQLTTLKTNLDAQLSRIVQWKAGVLQAYLDGKIDAADWAVAQVLATTQADAAHQVYLANTVRVYQQAGDAALAEQAKEKLRLETQQDLARQSENLVQAEERYHASTLKILKDFEDLQQKDVAKNFREAAQAAQELTQAEQRLGEAQKNLETARIANDFSAEEAAIAQLANFGIITEEQKAQRLAILYQQESEAALNSLRTLLAQEESVIAQAQQKLSAAQQSPFVSPAQITQLQANLAKAQAAYDNTAAEIEKTQQSFAEKQAALGQQVLSLALKQVAAELELAEAKRSEASAELASAASKGEDTAALQKENSALEAQVARLRQLQNGLKSAETGARSFANEVRQLGGPILRSLETSLQQTGRISVSVGRAMGEAISAVTAAYAQGAITISGALAQVAKAELQGIAAIVDAKGTEQLAEAFGSWPDAGAMAHHFASATLWFSLGGIIGAAAGALSGVGSGGNDTSSASSSSSDSSTPSPAQTPQQQPVQTTNTVRLAQGGLVTKKQLALIGDSLDGGDAAEAVLPLEDDVAMQRVGQAIADNQPTPQVERLFLAAISGRKPEEVPIDVLSPAAGGVRAANSPVPPVPASSLASIAAFPSRSANLADDRTLDLIAQRVAGQISPGHVTHDHSQNFDFSGVKLGQDRRQLRAIGKELGREVKKGKTRFTASNAFRVTKRG